MNESHEASPGHPQDDALATKRSRTKFGIEVVVAALVLGGVAGGITGNLTAGRNGSSSASSSTTTTVAPSTTLPPTTTTEPPSTTTTVPPTEPTTTTTIPAETLQQVVRRITLSVVDIEVSGTFVDRYGRKRYGSWVGSGFVMDGTGLIATNAHVVDGAETITVVIHDGTSTPGTVVGIDDEHDLAVVRIERTDLPPLELATDISLQVGDPVIAAGNALGLEGNPSITVGIISALNRSIDLNDGSSLTNLIQTDAAISSGDSGGPLLSEDGRVVGVNTAGAPSTDTTTAQNIGFAVPITVAAPILRALATT